MVDDTVRDQTFAAMRHQNDNNVQYERLFRSVLIVKRRIPNGRLFIWVFTCVLIVLASTDSTELFTHLWNLQISTNGIISNFCSCKKVPMPGHSNTLESVESLQMVTVILTTNPLLYKNTKLYLLIRSKWNSMVGKSRLKKFKKNQNLSKISLILIKLTISSINNP